jgi:hypothetical protein
VTLYPYHQTQSSAMPHAGPVNWLPISEMPLIASMIDGAVDDTREYLETLSEARTRPYVLAQTQHSCHQMQSGGHAV